MNDDLYKDLHICKDLVGYQLDENHQIFYMRNGWSGNHHIHIHYKNCWLPSAFLPWCSSRWIPWKPDATSALLYAMPAGGFSTDAFDGWIWVGEISTESPPRYKEVDLDFFLKGKSRSFGPPVFFLRDMHEMFQHLFTNKQVDHHPMGWWWFKSRWLKTSAENH